MQTFIQCQLHTANAITIEQNGKVQRSNGRWYHRVHNRRILCILSTSPVEHTATSGGYFSPKTE